MIRFLFYVIACALVIGLLGATFVLLACLGVIWALVIRPLFNRKEKP